MALTGPASFIPTIDEFIPHWTATDESLAEPIKVGGTFTVKGLSDMREALDSQQTQVVVARNGVEYSRGKLNFAKGELLGRLNQFNARLEADGAPQWFLDMRPKAFNLSNARGVIIPILEDLVDIWQRYNDENAAWAISPTPS
jgi:hypothetical protein